MSPVSIAVIAMSMSADACAAAIARGTAHRPTLPQAVRAGLVFGGIETVTPLVGWAVGLAASGFIAAIDHWVAFGLLSIVGGKMIRESFEDRDPDDARSASTGRTMLVLTAIGTSIDAAAVGVTLALLDVNIVAVALAIGFTTFVMATLGMLLGSRLGTHFGALFERLGGLALIGIGAAILAEHTGFIG
jgi:putative Mn2+ efflux pump MntP